MGGLGPLFSGGKMKKVRFIKNGYETEMTDKVAEIYELKSKVEILGNVKKEDNSPKKKVTVK
jgi:hypothetical protein